MAQPSAARMKYMYLGVDSINFVIIRSKHTAMQQVGVGVSSGVAGSIFCLSTMLSLETCRETLLALVVFNY